MNPLYLLGCTAAGKSALALGLARRVPSEIVSVDSMQVYRGLDIGTSKPSKAERAELPHHLIDVVDLDEGFNAGRFVELAGPALAEIQQRGRLPILCGGTGLYFSAFLKGLGTTPPGNATVRTELEALTLPELLSELQVRDPEAYGRIDHHNRRRIIRALEVARITGRAFSSQQAAWIRPGQTGLSTLPEARSRPRIFGLYRDDTELRERIEERVDAMFAAGLVEETRGLLEQGLAENRTASQAIGYRQVIDHLKNGGSRAALVEGVKRQTWRFAKRQKTWFRRQLPVCWLAVKGENYAPLVERLLQEIPQL